MGQSIRKRAELDFTIEQGTLADIEEIMDLLTDHYFHETTFKNLTPCRDQARIVFTEMVNNVCLVARHEGRIVGLLCANFVRTYYKETECDIDMFFVMKEFRGSKISRALIEKIVFIVDEVGVGCTYSSCLSGMGDENNKIYMNLWSKFGFKTLGTMMIRG